jgi:hypothetical protein
MMEPMGPPKQNLTYGCFFSKVGNYDRVVWLNVASLYKNFKSITNMRFVICMLGGGGGGGLKYNCVIPKVGPTKLMTGPLYINYHT